MDWFRRAISKRAYALPSSLFSNKLSATSVFQDPIPKSGPLPPQVLIQCLPNNVFVTVSSSPGHILFKLSSGLVGMKNAQKTAPKASMAIIDALVEKLRVKGIDTIRLNFRGINSARPLIISQLRKVDMKVTEVVDTTGIPFNGCRPKKTRRV